MASCFSISPLEPNLWNVHFVILKASHCTLEYLGGSSGHNHSAFLSINRLKISWQNNTQFFCLDLIEFPE